MFTVYVQRFGRECSWICFVEWYAPLCIKDCSTILALVVVVLLFLFFGGGAMNGSMLGCGMMGQGGIGGYRMGHGWITVGSVGCGFLRYLPSVSASCLVE